MAYNRIHRIMNGIAPTQSEDFAIGTRGAILLSINLNWVARTFYNIGTDEETVAGADIYTLIADAGTATSIIGQRAVGSVIDYSVVPQGGSFSWENPYTSQIRASADYIGRLDYYNGYPVQPVGVITGGLRIIAQQDPYRPVQHDLEVEAELMIFDSQLLG